MCSVCHENGWCRRNHSKDKSVAAAKHSPLKNPKLDGTLHVSSPITEDTIMDMLDEARLNAFTQPTHGNMQSAAKFLTTPLGDESVTQSFLNTSVHIIGSYSVTWHLPEQEASSFTSFFNIKLAKILQKRLIHWNRVILTLFFEEYL